MRVYIGYEPREAAAYAVARASLARHARVKHLHSVHGVVLSDLRARGLYWRTHELFGSQLYDPISDAPMSTEFAISRFLVPHLARSGWALFVDCDVMFRAPIEHMETLLDDRYAVMCVQHNYMPEAGTKMDGQRQTRYGRKNWSSVMAINCDHPANSALTLDMVNTAPGRDLHQFRWLPDDLIGELPPCWNHLVGVSSEIDNPAIVHWTNGAPCLPGYHDAPFADEFWTTLAHWAL